MARQTQGSLTLVGLIAGGVGAVAFVAMMVMGDLGFSAALFLSILLAAVVGVVLFFALHRGRDVPLTADQLRPRDEFRAPGSMQSSLASGPEKRNFSGLPPRPLPATDLSRDGTAAIGTGGNQPATIPGAPGYDERLKETVEPEGLVPGATHDPSELAHGMDTDPSTKPTSVSTPEDADTADAMSREDEGRHEGPGVAPGSAGVDAGSAGADEATRAAAQRTGVEGGMATANATPGGGGIGATGASGDTRATGDGGSGATGSYTTGSDASGSGTFGSGRTGSDTGAAGSGSAGSDDHGTDAERRDTRPGAGAENHGAGATGGAADATGSGTGGTTAYGAMSGAAVADEGQGPDDGDAHGDGGASGGTHGDGGASGGEASVIGVRPQSLDAPREGGPDDLKRIKGVGPKLEQMLHGMGYWHYDQIAAWTDHEVAWVDEHLEGFKGRVTRDNWVSQAGTLASGGTTEFSDRADKGEVYE